MLPSVPVRPPRLAARPALLGEVVVVVLLVRVYDWIRRQAATRSDEARQHALDLLGLERRLRLDVEHPANGWLAGHPHLDVLAVGWYQFAHIPVTIGLLAWCYWQRPDAYRPARNALVLVNLIGLAVFLAYPVMPPRLLPGAGFTDSLAATGLGSAPAGPVSADEFAAMPSLHLAWATWVAVLAATLVTGRVRRLLVAGYPLTTAAVTVGTANHYVLDLVAGVAVALLALRTARHVPAAGRRIRLPDGRPGHRVREALAQHGPHVDGGDPGVREQGPERLGQVGARGHLGDVVVRQGAVGPVGAEDPRAGAHPVGEPAGGGVARAGRRVEVDRAGLRPRGQGAEG